MKTSSALGAIAAMGAVLGAASAAPVDFPAGLKNLTNSDSYHMRTVRVVQARVQSDKPAWNAANGMFVSKYYTEFDEAFRGVMDTVNTASVEGALMYVQAEGINYATRGTSKSEWCTRKNNMNYVVFYEMVITQTNETLALYDAEYGTFLAMDGGQCTPTSGSGASAVYPKECYYYNGTDGQPNVGPFVGGEARETDPRAPYPDTWWFSFPNNCPLEKWANKTDECRATTRGGLCAFDTKPDGLSCTYNYRILGWVPIDDLVGITAMEDPDTGKTYGNFTEFCQAGNVEFNATTDGKWLDSIPFWENPQNSSANAARAETLVELYNQALAGNSSLTQVSDADLANFQKLPTIAELRKANPPCYETVAACATAANGCKRDLYGQICTKCDSAADGCEVAPSGFTFPTLVKATAAPSASSGSKGASSSASSSASASLPTPSPSMPVSSTPASSSSSVALFSAAPLAVAWAVSYVLA